MSISSIVINHEVRPAGNATPKALNNMIDYYDRRGEHDKGGCDRSITNDDRNLAYMQEIKSVNELVNYANRTGRFTERNPELPMVPGETSGGCWGQNGIIDPDKLISELLKSNSHIITSVVTVRRSEAVDLGLTTKQDFQRLLRSQWSAQAEKWGIIAPQNIKWAAFFHTDNPENIHCHVITWDKSGEFGGNSRPIIPHKNIWNSQEDLRKEALSNLLKPLNHERYYLRDYICSRIRFNCGEAIPIERQYKLESLRQKCNSEIPVKLDPRSKSISTKEVASLMDRVTATMPKGAIEALSYARCSKEVRAEVRNAVSEMRKYDPLLDAAYKRYEEVIRKTAENIGKRNAIERVGDNNKNQEQEYIRDAQYDLMRRCANSLLRNCKIGFSYQEISHLQTVNHARESVKTNLKDGQPYKIVAKQYTNNLFQQALMKTNSENRRLTEVQKQRIYDRLSLIATRYTARQALNVTRANNYSLQRSMLHDVLIASGKHQRRALANRLCQAINPKAIKECSEDFRATKELYRKGDFDSAKYNCSKIAEKLLSQEPIQTQVSKEIHYRINLEPSIEINHLARDINDTYRANMAEQLYSCLNNQENHDSNVLGVILSCFGAGSDTDEHANLYRSICRDTKRSHDAFRMREHSTTHTH